MGQNGQDSEPKHGDVGVTSQERAGHGQGQSKAHRHMVGGVCCK